MTYADIRLANDLDVPLYCLFERRSQNSRERERGVDHKTGSSIELAPSYFHHAVDGTGGFRLKIRTLIDAGAAMPEWHNLDSHGERFPAVWLSLARDRGGETTYWTHNVVSEGDYGDEPPFLLPKLMISTLKSTMGHAPEPSEEIKRWGRRMDAIKSLQASRLHALPTRWREIADLDFRRRVTQVAP